MNKTSILNFAEKLDIHKMLITSKSNKRHFFLPLETKPKMRLKDKMLVTFKDVNNSCLYMKLSLPLQAIIYSNNDGYDTIQGGRNER